MLRAVLILVGCLILGAAATLLQSCSGGKGHGVIVLHTGRMLGNAFPLSVKGIAPLQYYPYLAGYVHKVRQEAAAQGRTVFLIDSGDSLRGSFAAHATQSANMVALFKALEYDAIVLGNLDSAVRPEVVESLQPIAVLCPFVREDGSAVMPLTTWRKILTKNNQFLELVANFYGDVPYSKYPERFPNFYGADPQLAVKPFRDYAPNYVGVALPPSTLRVMNLFKYESKEVSAPWMQGLHDLNFGTIIAHRIYSGKVKDTWGQSPVPETAIALSENILRQNRGFTVARIDLEVVPSGPPIVRKQEIVQMTANSAAADPAIIQQMESFADTIRAADQEIAVLPRGLNREEILVLYQQALAEMKWGNAIIYSIESIRADWPAGLLRSTRVYEALPWDNRLFMLNLSPAEWQQASQMEPLTALTNDPKAAAYRVVTSAFYAALLRQKLQLSPKQIELIESAPEFDFFADFLRRHRQKLEPILPPGWQRPTS